VNKNATEVTLPLPSLIPGFYSIQIRSGSNTSNKVSFEVIPGNFVQSITATSPPIISAIYPPTVTQGGIFQITGSSLTSNVQFFDPNGVLQGSTFGVVSTNLTEVTAIAPYSIPPGIYTIGITGPFGLAKSLNVITITAGQVPIPPSAQSVPTATSTTTFQSLISGAFDYAVIVVSIAVFVMLLYAGFLWLTSPANPSNIARAKSMIYNAIIGAVLLLSAYVILNTINPELVGGNLNLPGISAPAPLPPVPQPPPPGGLCPNNQFGRPDNGCSGCVVMTVGIPRKSGVGDIHAPNPKVAPSVDTSLVQLQGAAAGLNLNWQVTEAYCPTVSHQDQDHYNGRAVDIAITGTATVQNVKNLCTIAKNAGFTVVNEYVSMGSQTTPECPAPLSSSTTTGDHLHIEN
jgi:hypothetical protein